MTTVEFKRGVSYMMNWVGDSTMKSYYAVSKRTAKTVTLISADHDEMLTLRIKVVTWRGKQIETVMPYGKYSMAPVLRASKPITK